MGLPKTGLEKRMREYACEHTKDTPKTGKPNSALYGDLWPVRGQGRETNTTEAPALLGHCGPVVNEQDKPDQPQKDDTQPLPL